MFYQAKQLFPEGEVKRAGPGVAMKVRVVEPTRERARLQPPVVLIYSCPSRDLKRLMKNVHREEAPFLGR